MDLTHCGWSDIFFLGMDFPEGARVLNVSIDLGVHGRDAAPRPPVEAYLRVIDEPVLRLVSVDLGATRGDHRPRRSLRLCAGLPRPAQGRGHRRRHRAAGHRRLGAEPRRPAGAHRRARAAGSNWSATSTTSPRARASPSRPTCSPRSSRVCMRATGQAQSLTGPLHEDERRLVLARAHARRMARRLRRRLAGLRRRLAGHQADRGRARRAKATPSSASAAAGCCRSHRILDHDEVSPRRAQKLQDSLVLVHGGMAQNVGPILEMVTEKYLLRSEAEWHGAPGGHAACSTRSSTRLRAGDVRGDRRGHHAQFRRPDPDDHPLGQQPLHRDAHRRRCARSSATTSGASGCSAACPAAAWASSSRPSAKAGGAGAPAGDHVATTKRELEHALPFAMEPVVYDFAINERGTWADLLAGRRRADAGRLLRADRARAAARRTAQRSSPPRRARAGRVRRRLPHAARAARHGADALRPPAAARPASDGRQRDASTTCSQQNGFDRVQHEQIRADLRSGRIGLAQNRLPASTRDRRCAAPAMWSTPRGLSRGRTARARPGGAARTARSPSSRSPPAPAAAGRRARAWSRRCIPFCKLGGRHRTFLEIAPGQEPAHRPRLAARRCRTSSPPATSRTSRSRRSWRRRTTTATPGPLLLSPGRAVGLAHGADGARPALRLGGNAAADARRAAAEGARQPARRADRLGASSRAKAATTPTTCRCSACTRSATGTRCRICSATACSPRLLGERPQLQAPAAAQHRHARRRRRPGAARPAHRAAARASPSKSSPAGSKTAAAAWRASTASCGWSKAWPCRARRTSSASPTTTRNTIWIDIDELLAAFGLDARRPRRRGEGRRGHPRAGRADADLHHAQGREEALGPRPGGRLPGRAVREAVGRHDRAAGARLPLRRRARACAASSSRTRRSSTAGCATARPPMSNRSASGSDGTVKAPPGCPPPAAGPASVIPSASAPLLKETKNEAAPPPRPSSSTAPLEARSMTAACPSSPASSNWS